jgi:hypothetical protein
MAAATLVLGVLDTPATGTIGNVRLVNLPTGAQWLRIRPRTSACKIILGYTGADDDAIGSTKYEDAPADADFVRFVGGHAPKVGVASASATVTFEAMCSTGAPS